MAAHTSGYFPGRIAWLALLGVAAPGALVAPVRVAGQAAAPRPAVTFARDIAPILQRSCQGCHRPGSVAPMSLLTYEDARPYAASIKRRTAIRWRQGTMPPWYIAKAIGIQHSTN